MVGEMVYMMAGLPRSQQVHFKGMLGVPSGEDISVSFKAMSSTGVILKLSVSSESFGERWLVMFSA
jgi:hypothetical protein